MGCSRDREGKRRRGITSIPGDGKQQVAKSYLGDSDGRGWSLIRKEGAVKECSG